MTHRLFYCTGPANVGKRRLLARVFLLEELPAWHGNRLKRLVKAPKLHLGDTGLACALLGIGQADLAGDRELFGQIAETFVYQELVRQSSWQEESLALSHFRDRDLREVDIVLEHGSRELCGIEVKTASTVRENDFKGLRHLRDIAGQKFIRGIVLYDGDAVLPFGDRLAAVPISRLWQPN